MTNIDDEIQAMKGMPEFGDGPADVAPLDKADLSNQAANNVYHYFVGGVAQ